jgi:hypothetical protein
MTAELIISAAIQLPNGVIASLPQPLRHHDVIHALHRIGVPDQGPLNQGFITSRGRYVGREEAVWVAIRAEQIILPKRTHPQTQLFSEDLW